MSPVSSSKTAKRPKSKGHAPAVARPALKDFLALDRQALIASILLLTAVVCCYSSITRNGFIGYDDPDYILDNAHVKAGLSWRTVEWAFLTNEAANWHPLTWLSHALDSDLFGINPSGVHWENVFWHALNAVLLFWLLRSVTGSRWRSLMVAALFALHPINVESVAWAAERKNVLSTFFFLLALYAYVWYARRPAAGAYSAVVGFFVLALIAKPQVITFPFLLLLLDYWPLGRLRFRTGPADRFGMTSVGQDGRELLIEKIPLFLLSAACAVVTMLAQFSGNAVKDLSRYSLGIRVENALVAYVRYLGKAFWPSRLVALYPHPTRLYPMGELSAAIFLLLLISAVVVWRLRSQPYLAVGWFWFLGSLVPMIGLVQVGEQAMADRYAYISFIGLFVMVVWLVADWAAVFRIPGKWLAAPAVVCLLVLGVLTYRQVEYWHDSESFWRRAAALTANNYIAERDLASVLHVQGRNEEATEHLRATLAINPGDLLGNIYFGADERARGNLASALEHFQYVAQHATRPRLIAQANTELGNTYRQMGDSQKARECFEQSLRRVPEQPSLRVTLGVMAQRSGDLPEAVRQFQRAAELQRSDVNGLLLAQALRQAGREDEAEALARRIQQISPNFAAAQKNAAALLAGN